MEVQSSFHDPSDGDLRCQKTRCNTNVFNVAQIRLAKFRCHNTRYKFLTEHPRTQGREMILDQFKLTSSHVTPLQEMCKLSAHGNKHSALEGLFALLLGIRVACLYEIQ